ncbi:glycosyltransferase [Streptodolium elevatio]|uniref:Glycosyltransferase n=1 Tax=Streptodolium elevatio TaxID=3157996 RepID=A0ABV3DIW0_9ACTN
MTVGSRGDAAPFTGLGVGLARRGHEVTLVTHARFEPLAAGTGVKFHALPVDPHEELHSARGRGLHRSITGAGKLARVVALARALAGELTDGLLDAAPGHDVLVASASLAPVACTLAESLGVPVLGAYLQPLHPTRVFAPPMVSARSLGPLGNRLAGHAVDLAVDHVFSAADRDLRRALGLRPIGLAASRRAREREGWPVLYGFSPVVVPPPRDWRPGLRPVGYWWPGDTRQLPDALQDFLAAGPPPAFVGLGSATVPVPDLVVAHVVRALRAAGLRGVIQRGWAGLDAEGAGDDMFAVDDVPHHLLFPRMAVVVHHCGAGTTGAGLRAGVPAVPVPVQFDAAFWARRLVRLGVAPTAVPLRSLTADRLGAALAEAAGNPRYRLRARTIADRVAGEDAVGAVDDALAAACRA